MNTYYCVKTKIDRRGNIFAFISGSVQAEKQPENTFSETPNYHFYNDWFASYSQAEEFVKAAKTAKTV